VSSDNRTQLNDCEDDAQTFSTTGAALGTNALAGHVIEQSNSVQVQHSNVYDDTYTVGDSAAATFNLDFSDQTVYLMVKDNGLDLYNVSGSSIVLGDGTDRIGYSVGGSDAVGMSYAKQFIAFKLDGSDAAANPGTADVNHHVFAGTEANLDFTQITTVGFGSLHAAKAGGNVVNVFIDGIYYIANGSYALTINGGTVGTPETMTDVAGDDITSGWGLVSNPLGSQYVFFSPTEWGESVASADHYFTADGEQWYWMGDNSGGRAIGADNFDFRVIGNATNTGLWQITNVAIVSTGARANFLMDDANVNTLEVDTCSMTGLGTIGAPSSGGTSRYCINTIFSDCNQITHNGADMSGCSILLSNVAAGSGALFYNETADPDGEMDNVVFSQGAAAHSAIEFGISVTTDVTLRGIDFTGFGSTDDVNGAVFKFLATTGSLNLNLVGCTTDGTFSVDDSAGIIVTVVIDPVTTLVHVDDNIGDDLQNCLVILEASDGTGDYPFEDTITITASGTTASVAHTAHGMKNNDKVVVRYAAENEYNGVFAISNVTTNAYDYTMTGSPSSPATTNPDRAAILASGVALHGLTDVNGDISASRTYTISTPVKGFARKSTSSPRFKSFPLSGIINNTLGLTLSARLILNE